MTATPSGRAVGMWGVSQEQLNELRQANPHQTTDPGSEPVVAAREPADEGLHPPIRTAVAAVGSPAHRAQLLALQVLLSRHFRVQLEGTHTSRLVPVEEEPTSADEITGKILSLFGKSYSALTRRSPLGARAS